MKKQDNLYIQDKKGQFKIFSFDMYCKQQHKKLTVKQPYELWLIKNKPELKEKWTNIHKDVNVYMKKKQKRKVMNKQLSNAILVFLGSFVCGVAYFIAFN